MLCEFQLWKNLLNLTQGLLWFQKVCFYQISHSNKCCYLTIHSTVDENTAAFSRFVDELDDSIKVLQEAELVVLCPRNLFVIKEIGI